MYFFNENNLNFIKIFDMNKHKTDYFQIFNQFILA